MRVFGIIGNCRGKNRLVPQLVGILNERGYRVSTLKRVGDEVDLDRPGKESYAHRLAGAQEVMIGNAFRWAIMSEYAQPTEPDIDALLDRLAPVDLVIIEGFHLSPYPKCEIVLSGQDRRPNYHDDPSILAVIAEVALDTKLPCFTPVAIGEIAEFIDRNACPFGVQAESRSAMALPIPAKGVAHGR